MTCKGDGTIVFGIKDKNITNAQNINHLKDYFDKVGIKYKLSDDIWRSLWLKYMLNVSSNQVSAVLGLNFGQMNSPKCKDLLVKIMQEVLTIAKAKGVKNTETMIEEALTSFSKMTPEGKTSMLQDIEAKRHTEVEIFAKTMIKLGKELSIPVPYNVMLNSMIEIIESQW
jgi:2-dehydropantoate 2-reductase